MPLPTKKYQPIWSTSSFSTFSACKDDRVSLIALTDKGQKVAEQTYQIQKAHIAEMFDGIEEKDAQALYSGMQTIYQNLLKMATGN